MKIRNYRQAEPHTEAPGVAMRTVIGVSEGAPHFAMRVFDIEPGASTPDHTHKWEHEVFVVDGTGFVHTAQGDRPISTGDTVFVAPNDVHFFQNTGKGVLRFVCCIPLDSE